MTRTLLMFKSTLAGTAGLVVLALGPLPAWSQKAPPAPPKGVRAFPRSTRRAAPGKVIRLAPGQTRITPEQLRKAPTVDVANRPGGMKVEKPARSTEVRIPGAPKIIRDLPPPSKPGTGTSRPLPKGKTAKPKPRKR